MVNLKIRSLHFGIGVGGIVALAAISIAVIVTPTARAAGKSCTQSCVSTYNDCLSGCLHSCDPSNGTCLRSCDQTCEDNLNTCEQSC